MNVAYLIMQVHCSLCVAFCKPTRCILPCTVLMHHHLKTPLHSFLFPGHDVIAQAQSGTGKTATFAISILQQIDVELKETQALVLAPTRELAQQVWSLSNTWTVCEKFCNLTSLLNLRAVGHIH